MGVCFKLRYPSFPLVSHWLPMVSPWKNDPEIGWNLEVCTVVNPNSLGLAKVNKGTFCYKCLCPTPFLSIWVAYAFSTGLAGPSFSSISTGIHLAHQLPSAQGPIAPMPVLKAVARQLATALRVHKHLVGRRWKISRTTGIPMAWYLWEKIHYTHWLVVIWWDIHII